MLQDAAALQSLHFNNSLLPPWLQDGLVNSVSALYKTGMWLADGRYRQFESFSCPQVNKSLLVPYSSDSRPIHRLTGLTECFPCLARWKIHTYKSRGFWRRFISYPHSSARSSCCTWTNKCAHRS
eukprot:COSAG03_NODE_398_length_8226_cov_34.651655_7_plen_125_part_00